jgi:hypothetical protein
LLLADAELLLVTGSGTAEAAVKEVEIDLGPV